MAQESRLAIVIDSNQAKVDVDKLNAALKELEAQGVRVVGISDKTSKGLGDVDKSAKAASSSLAEMATALGSVVSVATLWGRIQQTTMDASRYEQLGLIMEVVGRNAGYAAHELTDLQAELQKTGISMTQSRQVITQMVQAQMDLSHATQVARLAQDAATIGNISSSEALQRLVYGVQTAQTEILRNIGVVVNFEAAYKKLADELGKTTTALTENEKMAARVNAVMEQGPAIAGAYEASMQNAGKQLGSMTRLLDDLSVAMGEAYQPAFSAAIEGMSAAIKEAQGYARPLAIGLAGVTTAAAAATTGILALRGGVVALNVALNALRAHPIIMGLSVLAGAVAAAGVAFSSLKTDTDVGGAGLDEFGKKIDILRTKVDELTTAQTRQALQAIQEPYKAAQDEVMTLSARIEWLQVQLRQHPNSAMAKEWNRDLVNAQGEFDTASQRAEAYRQRIAELEAQLKLLQSTAGQTDPSASVTGVMEEFLQDVQKRIKAMDASTSAVARANQVIFENKNLTDEQKTAMLLAAQAEDQYRKILQESNKARTGSTKALSDAAKAAKDFERSRRQYLNGLYGEVSALGEQARGLEQQIELYGLAESAKYDLAIADLEQRKAALELNNLHTEEIAILERKIELLQQMKGSQQTLERLDAEKQAWESWSRDVEQIFDRVGQSLTDAIFDGGKSGRDLLRDLFKGLTFNILINPVMNQMQGWVTNQLGGLFGVQNPQQQGGVGILGAAQGASSIYSALTGGLTSGIASAAAGIGNAIGSSALTSFAAGMKGSTLAAGLAGPTTAGATGAMGFGAMAAKALPYIGVGLAALSLLSGSFKGEKRYGGGYEWAPGLDKAYYSAGPSGKPSAEVNDAIGSMIASAANTIEDVFKGIGSTVSVTRLAGSAESSEKGRGGTASGGYLDIAGELVQFGTFGKGTGYGGTSGSLEEMVKNLEVDLYHSIIEAWQAGIGEFPVVLQEMIAGIDPSALTGEQAQAIIAQVSQSVQAVNAFKDAVEQLPFTNLRDLSFDAAAGLIAAAGGLENLNAGMTSYFQTYYSEAEQLDHLSKQLSASFAGIGMEMPDVTQGAEAAKHAFRALFESIDPTTEAGQQAADVMLSVNQSFAQLVTGLDELANATARAAEETARAVASQRASLETQLLQAYGNTAALRAIELGNLDASNRALQQRIWALQDEAVAYQKAVEAYNQNRADTDAAWSTLQRVAQDQITRLQQTFTQTDSVFKALTKAVDVQRTALTEQMRASERLISSLRGAIDLVGSNVRDLRGQVDSTNAMQYEQAMAVIRQAAGGQLPDGDRLADAIAVARGVTEDPDQYASAFERDFAMLSLANELERIQNAAEPQLSVQEQALEVAKQQQQALENMLQEAKAQIDVLRGVDDKLYEQVLETIKTQLASQGQLDKLSDIDVNTFVAEKLMQDLVTAQMAEQQARLQIDAINNQVNIAQNSYNELRGINNKTSSMITALNNLAKAMDAERVTNPGTPSGGGTPTVVIPDVITSANHGFERYQVMGKRNYMPTTTEEWLDYVNLQPDLKSAFAAEVARGARTYSDAHMVEWARWHYNTSGKREMHVRRYASGGFYPGGIAMVGEEGPELINFAQPGQVYTANQTQDLLRRLSNPVENTSVIARHIERLTQENIALRQTVETMGRATVEMQYRMVRMLERWETDGMPDTREELQAQMLETLEDIKENGIKVIEEVSE